MMTVDVGKIGQLVDTGIEKQGGWLDPLAERLQGLANQAVEAGGPTGKRVKDFLNGTWLGHPLHPVLTDAAIGAWFTGAVLDLIGEESGADAALNLGVICALPTAASGMADWSDQSDQPRRMGLVHAMFNGAALALFVGSSLARRARNRPLGIGLSSTALTLATAGAYLGGELVYTLGTQINRNAWDPTFDGWRVAAGADQLVEGQPTAAEVDVDGQKISLVLLKKGGQVYAINGTCSHLGGPLAEGKVVDQYCIECPWHASRFDMRDGAVKQGPAAYAQQTFEVRLRDGNVDVRPRK
jgi:nitrite reductase/ring-hydroxylating ferredoxin subunit